MAFGRSLVFLDLMRSSWKSLHTWLAGVFSAFSLSHSIRDRPISPQSSALKISKRRQLKALQKAAGVLNDVIIFRETTNFCDEKVPAFARRFLLAAAS